MDARSDQYSLATVLYEMLVGEPPFGGRTAQAIVARRLTETARPIRPVRPGVPFPSRARDPKGSGALAGGSFRRPRCIQCGAA
jgi:serine/threonine protein kinase